MRKFECVSGVSPLFQAGDVADEDQFSDLPWLLSVGAIREVPANAYASAADAAADGMSAPSPDGTAVAPGPAAGEGVAGPAGILPAADVVADTPVVVAAVDLAPPVLPEPGGAKADEAGKGKKGKPGGY